MLYRLRKKHFDSVWHNLILKYLQDLGLDDKDIRIISNLSWNQTAEDRLSYSSTTEEFKIRESILSYMLFNLYVEKVLVDAISSNTLDIKVNGVPINNIRYADDTAILADDLQTVLNDVNNASRVLGSKPYIPAVNTGGKDRRQKRYGTQEIGNRVSELSLIMVPR